MHLRAAIALGTLLLVTAHCGVATARQVHPFNAGWRFKLGADADGPKLTVDDSSWRQVRLPHDWAISGPFDPAAAGNTGKLPWQGEAWYRKRFVVPKLAKGQRVYLLFDGVMAEPSVWINGKQAGEWDYGYNSFWVDATSLINPGESTLFAVHANTQRHRSRWYPGAGIYRKVSLHITNPVHVAHWGMHVRTPQVETKLATALVRCRVENKGAQPQEATITLSLLAPNGTEVLKSAKPQTQTIPARGSLVFEHNFEVRDPKLWSPNEPMLYAARAQIAIDKDQIDERSTRFGFRKVEFTPNYGMYLNGRRLQLKGVNLHHDLGPLGAAFSKPLMRRRLVMMKDMGANAIRTSHNPAAPELLDLCDELGFFVFNELFDKWDDTADLHDAELFEPYMQRQVRNFVLRDRNHPSVVVWSIGNEIGSVLSSPTPENRSKINFLVKEFKRHDETRPVTMGSHLLKALQHKTLNGLDLQSWNYSQKYQSAKERYPKKPTIYSESASALSTRGYYAAPPVRSKTDFDNQTRQIGSHDLNAAAWADIPDVEFERMQRDQYCAGEFVWTGYDYLGEPTPFDDAWSKKLTGDFSRSARSSYFGIVDLCGLPKDRYFLYRSHWAPEKTTIHLLPHWNWEQGQSVPVFAYTNGDEAELLLNGKSLGRRKKAKKAGAGYYGVMNRYRLKWDNIPFEPGELTVVAYQQGKEIGTATTRTAGKPHAVRLTADRKQLTGDGVDLSEVLVEVVDKEGVVCPTSNNRIQFELGGPAAIAGIGNGDPTSLESFVDAQHQVFQGKAVLLLRTRAGSAGEVRLTAQSEGLQPVSISIQVALPGQ